MFSRKRGNAVRDDIADDTPRAAFSTLSGSGLNRSHTSDIGSPAKKARDASGVDVSPRNRGNPRVELNRLDDEGTKRSRGDSLQMDRGDSKRGSRNEHDSVRVSSAGSGRAAERGRKQDLPLKQPVSHRNTEGKGILRQKSNMIYSDSDSSSDVGEVHRFTYKQISSPRDGGSQSNHRDHGQKSVSPEVEEEEEEEGAHSVGRKSVATPEQRFQSVDQKSSSSAQEKVRRRVARIIDSLCGEDVTRPMPSNLISDDEDVKADLQGQFIKVSVDILQKPDGTCSVRCLPDGDINAYVKLQNAKKDKVPVPLTSNSLKVIDPERVKYVQTYPGVQFYKTVQTEHVKMGRLKIDPRTIKPVETLSRYEMVLTALSGSVVIKSVQFKLTSNGIPALKSCELPEGHEVKIPNGSSYSIENWGDVQALLLFCLISN